MKPFLYYLEQDAVRLVGKDPALAEGLRSDAKYRLTYIRKEIITKENAKIILENLYEAVRALIEARQAEKGYKSYSHIATIAFAKEEKLVSEAEVLYVD